MCSRYQGLPDANLRFLVFVTRNLKFPDGQPMIRERAFSLLVAGYKQRFGHGVKEQVVLDILADRDKLLERFPPEKHIVCSAGSSFRMKPQCIKRHGSRTPKQLACA